MNRILITGVTGFVGSSLVNSFHTRNEFTLYGHSRNEDHAKQYYKGIHIEIISSLSAEKLIELRIDTIIHLAGIAHDLSNQYVEEDYYKVNFEATAKLYDDFLKSTVKRFIYFSSIKAAVDSASSVVDESVIPDPLTPYGKSKRKAEQYIQSKSAGVNQTYYLLRPCMIHGPGNKGNLNLLYRFVKTGIPYPLGAFENKRSYLGADNMVFMVEQLIQQSIPSGIYNLSDSDLLSTNEVVSAIAITLNKRPRIWNLPTGLLKFFFTIIGKRRMLAKLTENMQVSNSKILKAIHSNLPSSAEEGLKKTIRSFHA